MRSSETTAIDEYLPRLDGQLRGSARRRADLLAEARGGLEDAADAYQSGGPGPRTALAGALALLALALLGPVGRRLVLDPRRVVRPLATVAVLTCALIWTLGTFAAVTAVLEQPEALRWPPMIAASILLNATFALLGRAAIRNLTITRPPLATR